MATISSRSRREGVGMDAESKHVLRGLAARFDSAVARDEELAARDLARSLRSGRDTRGLIRAGAGLIAPTGLSEPIAELGHDYCVAGVDGHWLVPLDAVELLVGRKAPRPREGSEWLSCLLRGLGRSGAHAELFAASGRRFGVLVGAGSDHVLLETQIGPTAIPLAAIRAIRLVHGG